MSYRKMAVSALIVIIGIALIVFSARSMSDITAVKNHVQNMPKDVSNSLIGEKMSRSMMASASQYDTQVKAGLYSGIGLVIIGGLLFVLWKKKSNHS
jgi:LPXTG-motif cell wall-anchored protein